VFESESKHKDGRPFLTVKDVGGYTYSERLGVDSVAFILFNKTIGKYGLIKEYKPPLNRFLVTAFGGSLDKDIAIKQIVQEEVLEESGFAIDIANIDFVDKVFVSTQSNQFCYLFIVYVEEGDYKGTQPQNSIEAMASVQWVSKFDLMKTECWKAQMIYYKIK
jgi:8-oxo-dGTP pyrophosphatase MutT (NUDIX family)